MWWMVNAMQNAYSCMYTRRGLFATVLQHLVSTWQCVQQSMYGINIILCILGPGMFQSTVILNNVVAISYYLQLAEHALYHSSIHSNITYLPCLVYKNVTSADLVYPISCIWEMVIFVWPANDFQQLGAYEVCWGMPNALAPQFQFQTCASHFNSVWAENSAYPSPAASCLCTCASARSPWSIACCYIEQWLAFLASGSDPTVLEVDWSRSTTVRAASDQKRKSDTVIIRQNY